MTYTQTPGHFEALQWTGDNLEEFQALTLINDENIDFTANEDGSLRAALAGGGWSIDVPAQSWVVTGPYWGDFPGWDIPGGTTVDADQFASTYTATS